MLTKEQKIEDIRKQAIASNPEIVELKFGCFFKSNYDTWCVNCARCDASVYAFSCTGDKHSWPVGFNEKENWRFKWNRFEQKDENGENNKDIEIIGRPIGLQDVLLAICKTKAGGLYAIDAHGTFVYNGEDSCCDWNLHKDSLDEQTEETVDFIYQLIV